MACITVTRPCYDVGSEQSLQMTKILRIGANDDTIDWVEVNMTCMLIILCSVERGKCGIELLRKALLSKSRILFDLGRKQVFKFWIFAIPLPGFE